MDTWIALLIGALAGALLGATAVLLLVQPRIEAQRKELSAARAERDALAAERDALQAAAQQAEASLAELRKANAALGTEKMQLQNEIATIRPMLVNANKEKERLLIDVISLRAENERLTGELASRGEAAQSEG